MADEFHRQTGIPGPSCTLRQRFADFMKKTTSSSPPKKKVLLPRTRPNKGPFGHAVKGGKTNGAGVHKQIREPEAKQLQLLRKHVSLFGELYRKAEQIREEGERLRALDQAEQSKLLHEVTTRLEMETKRNRFFTLPILMLAIAGFDGHFVELNSTWKKTLGYTDKELASKAFLQFAHPEDQANATEQLGRLQANLGTGYFENRFCCKDGSIRWLGWSAAAFPEEQLIYIFARDISARKAAEERIAEMCSESQEHLLELTGINQQLQAFNYSVSHDLQAPLRRIRGLAQAVLEDCGPALNSGAKDYLKRIGSSASYMDTMLRDLLDYSRLSQSQCKPTLLNLESAVRQVLAQFEVEISAKNVGVEIQAPLAKAWGHLPIFTQIVSNLVDNALKFTQENLTPHIRIWTEAKGNRIRLCVEDNGVGIAPAHQQRVFGLFVRLHPAPAYPGTGVGLALVQKGAERMGGAVGVESQSGKGSRFWLELDGEKNRPSPSGGTKRKSKRGPGTSS
jgi:PAS domain S-box-containing protein